MTFAIAGFLVIVLSLGASAAEPVFVGAAQDRHLYAIGQGVYSEDDLITEEVALEAENLDRFQASILANPPLHSLWARGFASQDSEIRNRRVQAIGSATASTLYTRFASGTSACMLQFQVTTDVECTVQAEAWIEGPIDGSFGTAEVKLMFYSESKEMLSISLDSINEQKITSTMSLAPGIYTLDTAATATAPAGDHLARANFSFSLSAPALVPVEQTSMGRVKALYAPNRR